MNLESVTKNELKVMRLAHDSIGRELKNAEEQAAQGCRRCSHFSTFDSRCHKHGAVVPAEFVAQGCDDWKYDTIPF